MPETPSVQYFPSGEQEFRELGVKKVEIETTPGGKELSDVHDFCSRLPTVRRLVDSYGMWNVWKFVARQLEHQNIAPHRQQLMHTSMGRTLLRIMKANCWVTALNYCIGEKAPYTDPLPYSVALVLVSQLAYGVRERFTPPEHIQERIREHKGENILVPSCDTPIDATVFRRMTPDRKYFDPLVDKSMRDEILRQGLVTLVGACLLYLPVNPYENNFVLRKRTMRAGSGETEWRYTIPGGHTRVGQEVKIEELPGINTGRDKNGHTILDVPYLREVIEETGIEMDRLVTARPHTLADQIIWPMSGDPVRYLAYIARCLIWDDTLDSLRDGDGFGDWNEYGVHRRPFGIDEERGDAARLFNNTSHHNQAFTDTWEITGAYENFDFSKRDILEMLPLTPIAQIALERYS